MLGNRDGEVLADVAHRETKLQEQGRSAARDPRRRRACTPTSGSTSCPSLHDWKTAWDFVHFEGFLGARMSLQFTWQGSDSALAAPLVLDLARLADFAARARRVGRDGAHRVLLQGADRGRDARLPRPVRTPCSNTPSATSPRRARAGDNASAGPSEVAHPAAGPRRDRFRRSRSGELRVGLRIAPGGEIMTEAETECRYPAS